MSNTEVYEKITGRMIKRLEAGTVPWERPWRSAGSVADLFGARPRSMSTRQTYKGINWLILSDEAAAAGYVSPWWGTYNQIAELSGMVKRASPRTGHSYWVSPDGTPRGVRKGEHGTQIVLWKSGRKAETDPDTGEKVTRRVLLARLFTVFNAAQADQLPTRYYGEPDDRATELEEIPDAEEIFQKYLSNGGPRVRWLPQDRAYYNGRADMITLPERSQFPTAGAYWGIVWHEAGHSTGHPDRLNREGIAEFDHFGTDRYGREELVAQMTSAMLQAITGTETDREVTRSAAYLASWLNTIKADVRLVPQAAAAAQRAVDLITGEAVADDQDQDEMAGQLAA